MTDEKKLSCVEALSRIINRFGVRRWKARGRLPNGRAIETEWNHPSPDRAVQALEEMAKAA